MSGVETDYISTRGEALPPPAEPERRTRKARPNPDDNPRGGGAEQEPEDHAAPEPDAALTAMSARASAAERKAADLEAERLNWQKERDELQRGKGEAETRGVNAQKVALENAIGSEQARLAGARQAYRAAREAGDLDAEDKANDAIAETRARLVLLDRDKSAWADWEATQAAEAEAAKRNKPAAREAPERGGEPAPAAVRGLTPQDQQWVEGHPDFGTDPECEQWIRGAADRVIADGIQKGSPAFYRELTKAYARYGRIRELDEQAEEPPPQRGARQQRQEEPEEREPPPRRAAREPSAASMGTPPSRGGREWGARERGVSPEAVARKMGTTVQDLQEFARGRQGGLQGYVNQLARDLGMT